jgi:signal transduction histidine kinase
MDKAHIELIVNKTEMTNFKITSDYTRIKQICRILLDNALKFTESGTVTFGTEVNATENNISFYVKDSGIGIPEDKQRIIFKSFTQSDITIRQSYGGLGVGLSIASGIVKLLDGEISLVSAENSGTKVIFRLPV